MSSASIASEAVKDIQPAESIDNGTEIDNHLSSNSQQESENVPRGNILDAFLSIVAKKPTIGQEIDTLASILPKAMDLNAPTPAASDATLAKDHPHSNITAHDTDNVFQRSSVRANQNQALDHSHSDTPSPVATAIVSGNCKAQGQTTGTNGVSKASVTKTKGLSASAWA